MGKCSVLRKNESLVQIRERRDITVSGKSSEARRRGDGVCVAFQLGDLCWC